MKYIKYAIICLVVFLPIKSWARIVVPNMAYQGTFDSVNATSGAVSIDEVAYGGVDPFASTTNFSGGLNFYYSPDLSGSTSLTGDGCPVKCVFFNTSDFKFDLDLSVYTSGHGPGYYWAVQEVDSGIASSTNYGTFIAYYDGTTWSPVIGGFEGFPATITTTRIKDSIPSNGSNVATSSVFTNIGATGRLLSSDDNGSVHLHVRYWNEYLYTFLGGKAVRSVDIHVPVGFFTLSATSSLAGFGNFGSSTAPYEGRYQMELTLIKDTFAGLWSTNLDSTTTTFTVGELNQHDIAKDNHVGLLASSTALIASNCKWDWSTQFDFGACISSVITALIFPDQGDWDRFTQQAHDLVLDKFPIGYVTRLVNILSSEATTTLPVIDVTMKAGTPLEGEYKLDPAQYIASANNITRNVFTTDNSIVASASTKNVWDVIMPDLTILGWLMLVIRIFFELIGHRPSKKGFQEAKT